MTSPALTLPRDWLFIVPRAVSMASIAADVARRHRLSPNALWRRTRAAQIAHPRQEAMARMRDAGWSNAQAAGFFGLADHSTCRHAVKAVAARAQRGVA